MSNIRERLGLIDNNSSTSIKSDDKTSSIRSRLGLESNYSPVSNIDTKQTNDILPTASSREELLNRRKELNDKLRNQTWNSSNKSFIDKVGYIFGSMAGKNKYNDEQKKIATEISDIDKKLEEITLNDPNYYSKGLIGSIDKVGDTIAGNVMTSMKGIESTAKKVLGQKTDSEMNLTEKLASKARQDTAGAGGIGLDVLGSVSRMLPQMAAGNPITATGVGFANYGGSAYNEAKRDGATEKQATMYGIASGGLEMGLQNLLGSTLGKVYQKSGGSKIINNVTKKIIKNDVIRDYLSEIISEGGEEYLQEILNPIVRNITLNENNEFKPFTEEALYAGLLGGLTSGIMNAPSSIVESKIKKKLNNTELNTKSDVEINSNNNQYIQENSLGSLNYNENSNQSKYQYLPTTNEKINNLKQSASQYFNNSNETNSMLNTMEKVIKDKNYNIVFDNTITNKLGNSVNAKIETLPNGEVEIRINPNSSRAGEFLLTHEITHAIETSSMKQLVLDYANKNAEFNQSLESLKIAYGTDEVSSEVLADISGQLFGNQEFINSLSIEQPGIFKRLYNKIVELANKVTGNSKESLFIKDLKNKWEEAYRTTTTDQAVSNINDKRFSIQEDTNGNKYVNVDTDQDIFEGKKISEQTKIAKQYILEKFRENGIDVNNENISVTSRTANEYTHPKNQLPTATKSSKMKASTELDNLLSISKYQKSAMDDGRHPFAKDGWDYYETTFKVGDNLFTGLVNIAKSGNKKTLYDITNIKRIDQNRSTSANAFTTSLVNSSESNISQSNENVKSDTLPKYSMQNNENNTQELDNSSFSLEQRVSGDTLPDAQDLIDEVKSVGANNADLKVPLKGSKTLDVSNYLANDTKYSKQNDNGSSFVLKNSEGKNIDISNLNENSTMERYHYNRKYDKNNIVAYRGISESSGSNPAFYGLGLYTTLDYKYAKQYGDVLVVDNKFLPDNPLKFRTQNDFQIWEQELARQLGVKKRELYSSDYGVEQYIKRLGYDGLMIGTGKDTDLVSFKETAVKYSTDNSTWQEHLEKNYKATGTRTYFKDILKSEQSNNKSEKLKKTLNIKEDTRSESDRLVDKKIYNNARTIGELEKAKKEAIENINKKITEKRELYKTKKNKNTKIANIIQQQAISLENQRNNIENAYNNRIKRLEERNKKLSSNDYKTENQRKNKMLQYREEAESLIIDNIDTWKDKVAGILYKTEKMDRNIKDIIPDKNIADKIVDTYYEPIKYSEAKMEEYITYFNDKIKSLNLSNEESVAVQMLGEGKFNGSKFIENVEQAKSIIKNSKSDSDSKVGAKLYLDALDYIENNNLDIKKIEHSVNYFRKVYDKLYSDINLALKEQGFKELEYRKDYFPHFQEEHYNTKVGKIFEKLGWKKINNDIPTDIAGITDLFKPNRTYFSHAQRRFGNSTEYNVLKGFDQYVRGAANWIYMTEHIQKLRALESEIRYLHSEKGIQEQYDQIINDNSLSTDEKQTKIEQIFENANNPLNNFVTELRSFADGLANKKSELDRRLESNFNRTVYSTMTNIQSRVSANMVGLNISSALTNFIPITQATSQVSTKNLLKAMKDTISNSIKSDGFSENSEFLVNRTMKADRLYKTNLDKISDKMGIVFDSVDNFTSNVVVRGKYLQNIENGMTPSQAMKNANQFANNLMAGRDKASLPTIYNSKNPIIKLFSAFQLEVNNQYRYMLKDLPNDLKDKGTKKLVGAFIKMFLGAWLYNKISEEITGRKSAFSPADIVLDSIKTIQNNDLSGYEKLVDVSGNVAQELPFVGGLLGGGRLPISAALPNIGTVTKSAFELSDKEKSENAWNSIKKELSKPLYYLVPPFGGGQLKKTVEGLGMYAHSQPGSYTTNGKLRFTAKTDPLSVAQNAIFGQYASKEGREYYEKGYTALTEKQQEEFMNLDVSMNEYRSYLSHLSDLNKIKADKDENNNPINGSAIAKQVYDLVNNKKDYSEKEINYLLGKLSSNSKHSVTIEELSKIDNDLDVYKYYFKLNSDSKNNYIKLIEATNINQKKYVSAIDDIDKIQDKYNKKKEYSSYTGNKAKEYTTYLSKEQKKELFNYINSLDINKAEKIILYKKSGYSITNYKDYMYKYINNLNATKRQKQELWKLLY